MSSQEFQMKKFLFLIFFTPLAMARCDYSDLAGTWDFYGASAEGYTICTLRITGSGNLNERWSTCMDLNGNVSPAIQGSGTFELKVDSNCYLSGSADTRDFGRGQFVGTINRDRSIMTLFASNGVSYTTLHGVKH